VELELVGVVLPAEPRPPADPSLPVVAPTEPEPPPEPPRIRAVVTEAKAGEYVLGLVDDERPRGLNPGTRVVVRFITTLGLHHGNSVVVQVDPGGTDKPISLILTEVSDLQTIQRRKYFRVSAVLPVDLAVLESTVKDLADAEDHGATTLNLSGGGFLIETRLHLALGDHVRLTLRVPKELRQDLPELMLCQAYVVRVEVVSFDRFRVALQSSFPRETGRDLWVQLTLNLQFGRA
jgi:hypothetical protein